MEVVPAIDMSKSGRRGVRVSFIFWRRERSWSQVSFLSRGAFCPKAEKVSWLSRSSISSAEGRGDLKPAAGRALLKAERILFFSVAVRRSK